MLFQDITKKRGTFSINFELIEENPGFVMEILGNCIIARAEFLQLKNCVKYSAYCKAFREIEDNDEIPHYKISYRRTHEGMEWFFWSEIRIEENNKNKE